MIKDVINFVSRCQLSQQTKYMPMAPARLLQRVEPPSQVCEDTSTDFVVRIPAFQGNTVIIVVIDRFSKTFLDATYLVYNL